MTVSRRRHPPRLSGGGGPARGEFEGGRRRLGVEEDATQFEGAMMERLGVGTLRAEETQA